MRRVTLCLGSLAFVLAFSHAPAYASGDYPYCLSYVIGWGGMFEDCSFLSMAQCRASAGGVNGQCAPNWRMQRSIIEEPPPPPPPPVRHKRRHYD